MCVYVVFLQYITHAVPYQIAYTTIYYKCITEYKIIYSEEISI